MLTLAKKLQQLKAQLSQQLFPTQCLLCACTLHGDLLCGDCQYDLPHVYGKNICQQCGLACNSLSYFCGHCLSNPPAFSHSFIPFAYEYPLDGLIHKFKYQRHLTSGKLLGQLLADYLQYHAQDQDDWHTPDMIVPAPMHWLKRWQRGFNQAEFLGKQVARALEIPFATHLIQRVQKTPAQKELTRAARQHNLRKAFVIADKHRAAIAGKHIALIDDVVTTTATARALSQLLLKSGAKEVQIWALARTMSPK